MDTNYTANKAKEFSNQTQDFFKSFSNFSMSNMDFNDLFNLARRNMEACSAANQVMMEGAQAINKRTAEVIQSNVEKCLSISREMMNSRSSEVNGKKSSEVAKDAFSSSVNSVREISEMISKSTFEAFDLINKRCAEAMEEAGKLSKKAA